MRQFIYLFWFLMPVAANAQVWQRYYDGDRLFALQALADGSLLAAGQRDSGFYLLHTDINGVQLSANNYQFTQPGLETALLLLPDNNTGWQLWGNNDQQQILSMKANISSTALTPLSMVTGGTLYHGMQNIQGASLICGSRPQIANSTFTQTLVFRQDTTGQILWLRSDSIGLTSTANAVFPVQTDQCVVLGTYIASDQSPNFDFFLQKIGSTGNLTETFTFNWPGNQQPISLLQGVNSNWIITGTISDPTNFSMVDDDIWITSITPEGEVVWTTHFPMTGFQIPHKVIPLPDGNYAIVGETRIGLSGSRDAFLALVDPYGQWLWYKTYGGLKGDIFWDITRTTDGGFAMAGQTASFGDGTTHAWLVRTDANGNLWQNIVHGRVFYDAQQNCVEDAGEQPLKNWLIAAAGANGRWFTQTDSTGAYHIPLDTGTWYISVLPFADAWAPCTDSVEIILSNTADSVALDFPVQAALNCPVMEVDLATPFLRRCFGNTYTIKYSNYGTEAATQAQVRFVPDPAFIVANSDLAFTSTGDTLVFDIGQVGIQESGTFRIYGTLDCNSTVLGQMHCSVAHITPDSVCSTIHPQWDGAALEVNGYCAGDSVVLTIRNVGIGGMTEPVEYVITEDQIIFKKEPVLLAAGESTTIVVYPNGATITLQTGQTPGYPGTSTPMLVIEGCGGPVSTGYAFQFPTNDGDLATDIDCRPNIGAFDPNDKSALPSGALEAHYIAAGAALEYTIRFQNTGTDTAFRVEICDPLPPGLDWSTLEAGAGSHPYTLNRLGTNQLRFIFDPILLPDSNTNLVASQGFVKFRIRTNPDLPDGTTIRNKAAIYFDFNTPIETEYTLHTIGKPVDYLPSGTQTPENAPISPIMAMPNPFTEHTQVSWPVSGQGGNSVVRIYNNQGQLIAVREVAGNQLLISKHETSESVLFLQIWQNGHWIAAGRLIQF